MKQTPKRIPYPTEIAAYAGFDIRGNIAFGTIRSSREACAAEVERIAPTVAGFAPPLRVLPVYIGLDLNTQLDMPLDGPEKPAQRV